MKISTCILNWKRPANVRQIIAGLRQSALVDDITVWNNNANEPFEAENSARVVNCNCDLGLYTRFAAAALARHPVVLIQDDDLELPSETIAGLLECWCDEPNLVHGIFGRTPRVDGTYAADVKGNAEVPIVLTRACVVSRATCTAALLALNTHDGLRELLSSGRPEGNGEDILLSYVAQDISGELNRVHKLPVTELPAPHAIHGRAGHIAHRTKVMHACQAWLERKELVA